MHTYINMPHGYRYLTADEFAEFENCAPSRRCGWMNHLAMLSGGDGFDGDYIVKWDCMIEFGMDHDHDPAVCERIMADMNPDYSYAMDNDYDMQSAHYEQFGRPAFPNEY